MIRPWLPLLAALLGGTAVAALPPPVHDALAQMRAGQAALAAGWRYQEQVTGSGGSERLEHDPARPAGSRWRVVAIDGKAPSAAQAARLAAQAEKAAHAAGGAALAAGPGWLEASEYRLVGATDKTLVYQIRPHRGGLTGASADLLSHLSGRLEIARADHRPLRLSLSNFESFSPRFGVKIENFTFKATFRRLRAGGPVVVERAENEASGTVFWFKHFDNRTAVVLSHFAPAIGSAPAAASAAGGATSRSPSPRP